MLFNVPQYIDVEDKVAGPFTAKQLLWMFGCGATLLVLWNTLDKITFIISAIPIILIFAALAFYRPYNQPLIKFIYFAILFLFRPKVYIWRRIAERRASNKKDENKSVTHTEKKKEALVSGDVEELAKMLDSAGHERSDRIMEIIKQKQLNKQK
jgi:hypothetical protein